VRLLRRHSESSFHYLVVGLGNPGRRYAETPHNLGFKVVEELCARLDGSFRSKFKGRLAEVRDGDERLALLCPETFMNGSGDSVGPALRYYKLPVDRLLIVHDEIDLGFGDVRAKAGGGLAGHNGLRSVTDVLGTKDYLRVRIGVGRPERGDRRPVADWLLAPFPPGTDTRPLVEAGADCALAVTRRGIDAAMREFNGGAQ
jgi:PTH1 family peptidyl-tRNA hydrolase